MSESNPLSDLPLRFSVDQDLSYPLLVGSGTILALHGWCYHPQYRITQMNILLNEKSYPVVSHSGLREDIMRAHVPRLDTVGNSLNSGFEALIPVAPVDQLTSAKLRLRVQLSNKQIMEAEFGSVILIPDLDVEIPSFSDLPDHPRLVICMATYNPPWNLFIDQIESIRQQTFENWICIINDDCSSPEIFVDICRITEQDRRFIVYQNEKRLGFYHNFERCLKRVPADIEFVAFADQDDYWYPDKIEVMLAAFESDVNLVYCDLHLVTHNNEIIAPTFWTGRDNNYTDLAALVLANTITGAASIFRTSLLAQALPFPEHFWDIYHDHWLACIALASGRIVYIDRALYDYRQHSNNVLGYKLLPIKRFPSLKQILDWLLKPHTALPTLDALIMNDYVVYWDYVVRIAFCAQMLCLRLPNIPDDKRRQLQQMATLDRSIIAWIPHVVRYCNQRQLTFGLEWYAMRGLISKRYIDSHFQRDKAIHIRHYINSLKRDEIGR